MDAADSIIDSALSDGGEVVLEGTRASQRDDPHLPTDSGSGEESTSGAEVPASTESEHPLDSKQRVEREGDKIALLTALPGVGPVTAKRLLEKFGTIQELAASKPEKVVEVSGIGYATAGRIIDLLSR